MRISDWSSDVCSSDLFRLDYGRRFQDSTMTALVRELQGSSQEFSLWWGEHQVLEREGGFRRFDHQREGSLTFEQLTLVPTPDPSLKLRSEEHTSELQSLMRISYAVSCLKQNKHRQTQHQ